MLRKLLKRFRSDDRAEVLYGKIVAQARQPGFYADVGVTDTPEGRFDMIVLHIVLVMRRLHAEGEPYAVLAQDMFDGFFADMDQNLREMGTSDLAVPKRVRGMAEAYQGRASVYGAAIDEDNREKLKVALERNLFSENIPNEGSDTGARAEAMATYMLECERVLANTPGDRMAAADIDWPEIPDVAGCDSGEQA